MATHYHARDRTGFKNSRDGLQKENLRTKEVVSVSKKEKEILFNTGGESVDLSGEHKSSVSRATNRRATTSTQYSAAQHDPVRDDIIGASTERGFGSNEHRDNQFANTFSGMNRIASKTSTVCQGIEAGACASSG